MPPDQVLQRSRGEEIILAQPQFLAAFAVIFVAGLSLSAATSYMRLYFKKEPVPLAKPLEQIPLFVADYVLTAINPEQQKDFRGALAALKRAAVAAQPGVAGFASLPVDKQIAVMKAMEKPSTAAGASNSIAAEAGAGGKEAEAFGGLRAMVLMGTFCDPSLHGNHSKIGWNLIGFDDQAYWAPPFGYYDAHPEEKA